MKISFLDQYLTTYLEIQSVPVYTFLNDPFIPFYKKFCFLFLSQIMNNTKLKPYARP